MTGWCWKTRNFCRRHLKCQHEAPWKLEIMSGSPVKIMVSCLISVDFISKRKRQHLFKWADLCWDYKIHPVSWSLLHINTLEVNHNLKHDDSFWMMINPHTEKRVVRKVVKQPIKMVVGLLGNIYIYISFKNTTNQTECNKILLKCLCCSPLACAFDQLKETFVGRRRKSGPLVMWSCRPGNMWNWMKIGGFAPVRQPGWCILNRFYHPLFN